MSHATKWILLPNQSYRFCFGCICIVFNKDHIALRKNKPIRSKQFIVENELWVAFSCIYSCWRFFGACQLAKTELHSIYVLCVCFVVYSIGFCDVPVIFNLIPLTTNRRSKMCYSIWRKKIAARSGFFSINLYLLCCP